MSQDPKEEIKQKSNAYLKYSGLAFQLATTVGVGILVGQWLDKKFNLTTPFITIILILLLFSGFMYKLYIDLTKNK